jgi:hypothetical protein
VQLGTVLRVLLGDGLHGPNVEHPQPIPLRHLDACLERLGEVIAGVQEEHIGVRGEPAGQVRQHAVLHGRGHGQPTREGHRGPGDHVTGGTDRESLRRFGGDGAQIRRRGHCGTNARLRPT